jgi:DNA repair protein RadD
MVHSLIAAAREQGGNAQASILWHGERTSTSLAALVNGSASDSLDFADSNQNMRGHSTPAVVATALAMAEAGKLPGIAFLRGVMIFAATVKHAKEVMDSLPPGMAAIVTGDTDKDDRKRIIRDFKAQKIKYLVNVSVLTTGFDAAHVDMIAILRATESVGLLQQIIGRGLRIEDFMETCLILDYAENLPRHCPDGDVFNPKVKVAKGDQEKVFLKCICPLCDVENEFSARPNNDGYDVDENGYFTDLDGNQIETEWGGMPAHFGRRCSSTVAIAGDRVQCTYRWTFKPCPHCKSENDIAARYCTSCKGEIVDPNTHLVLNFKAVKKDPTIKQTDQVRFFTKRSHIARSGNETWRCDVVTEYRSFSFWIMKNPVNHRGHRELSMLNDLCDVLPSTITYQKDATSGFYRVFAFNDPHDIMPVIG